MSGRSSCLLVPSPRSSEEELQDNPDKTSSERSKVVIDVTRIIRYRYSFASLELVGAVSEMPLYHFARVGAPEMRSVSLATWTVHERYRGRACLRSVLSSHLGPKSTQTHILSYATRATLSFLRDL